MREPRFWRRRGAPAQLLTPFAAIYGAIAGARMARPGASAGVPVICIGNLTVGGAGKTPTAIAVAQLLIADGARPVFLTRGYGGNLAGPVRVTPEHNATDVGDEPLLLAQTAPTIVARDRARGAAAAAAAGAEVIVMDDGFQNPALNKDVALVVLDGERGIGNEMVFPAGPLRAPLDIQLAHASALLVVGLEQAPAQSAVACAKARGLPILRGRLAPDPATLAGLKDRKVLAFAGIGHPEKFFATLAASGVAPATTRSFPDHHVFTRAEMTALLQLAEREGLSLVTTEKDLMRLRADPAAAALAACTSVLPVRLIFEDEDMARQLWRSANALAHRGAGARRQ
jgi:tetraacyldisaccharide 4'-kinase